MQKKKGGYAQITVSSCFKFYRLSAFSYACHNCDSRHKKQLQKIERDRHQFLQVNDFKVHQAFKGKADIMEHPPRETIPFLG